MKKAGEQRFGFRIFAIKPAISADAGSGLEMLPAVCFLLWSLYINIHLLTKASKELLQQFLKNENM